VKHVKHPQKLFIIKDCGIKVLLTERVNFENAQQVEDRNIKLRDIHISYSLEETKADIYNDLEADLEF
jgi:hypothetical protein